MDGERKRKFNLQRARQQERTQRVKTNNTAPMKYQSTMQYRSPRTNSQQTTSAYRSYNYNNKPKSNNNVASKQTCFRCRQPGHRIAQCPYANQSVASAPTSSKTSNRTTASGIRRTGPQNSGQQKRNPQSFSLGLVNHMNAEEG